MEIPDEGKVSVGVVVLSETMSFSLIRPKVCVQIRVFSLVSHSVSGREKLRKMEVVDEGTIQCRRRPITTPTVD